MLVYVIKQVLRYVVRCPLPHTEEFRGTAVGGRDGINGSETQASVYPHPMGQWSTTPAVNQKALQNTLMTEMPRDCGTF